MAIALMLGSFAFAQANETPVDEYGCPDVDSMKANHCRMKAQADRAWEADQEPIEEYPRIFGEITDVDPLDQQQIVNATPPVDCSRFEGSERSRCETNESIDFKTPEDPLETAQGGDRDGDVGGGDFGGENDRAAASTAAE